MLSNVLKGRTLSIIGSGAMGTALMRGLIESGAVAPEQLLAVDVVPELLEAARDNLGVLTTKSYVEAMREGAVVVLAVKPQVMEVVLRAIAEHVNLEQHLIISIAAGVPLATLQGLMPPGTPVIRVMPNTPAQVLAGATAVALGADANESHGEIARAIFGASGLVVDVDEKLIDAVTALSGSGPAYVCLFIEALADAGVNCGLDRKTALQLAAQTVMGSAKMILETGDSPSNLKDRVASPGGTTIAAIQVLERSAFRGSVMEAVFAAFQRAKELGAIQSQE